MRGGLEGLKTTEKLQSHTVSRGLWVVPQAEHGFLDYENQDDKVFVFFPVCLPHSVCFHCCVAFANGAGILKTF